MTQCSCWEKVTIDGKPGNRQCGMVANESGFCPRHELLIPALEAAKVRKQDEADRKKKDAAKKKTKGLRPR